MFVAVILVLILIATALLFYARWNYGCLDRLGFPIMKPSLFLGSDPQLHTKVQHLEDIKRYKKYGPIWGYYQGRTPVVFIADPELIKSIWIKDSSHFYNRAPLEFGDEILNQILDFLPDEKWKTMRVTQTKLFSVAKLKQYNTEVFNEAMNTFLDKLDADIQRSGNNRIGIDARDRFCTYTVDVIARSMFSTKVDPEKDARFYSACKKLIGEGQEITKSYVWTLTFPWLARFAPTLVLDHAMTDSFLDLVKSRTKSGMSFGDYGDVLVSCFKLLKSPIYLNLGITENTLLGQATNLFIAGFDRISSQLTFLAYHLALKPESQDRLVAEIRETLKSASDSQDAGFTIDYQTLQEMEYLNACVLEIARLYSILIRPERVCNKDWEDPIRGIRIPKGVVVMIASWAVNRDPQNYENPNEFVPERFLPEEKSKLNPYAYTTFGFGHRSCIGMRFAYEAIKVAMVRLLLRYRFELRGDTRLTFKKGLNFILQFEPVSLDVVQRDDKSN